MIHEVVEIIKTDLNNYLKLKFATTDNKVLLTGIMDQNGQIVVKEENKVLFSVVNVARDGSRGGRPANTSVNGKAPVSITFYLLFSAFFSPDNYTDALKFLSGVIAYFQSKGSLSHHNMPNLSAQVGTLSIDLMDMTMEESFNMWNALGAKYMPSVLYRVRALSISDERVRDLDPAIKGLDV